MRFSVQVIKNGFTSRIGAPTSGALMSALSESYGVDESELQIEETDEGDLVSIRGGETLGIVEYQPSWPASSEFSKLGCRQ